MAIITVLQLPPKLSLKIEVIIEFLYGTCTLVPLAFSCRAIITYSKYDSDLLMYLASVLIYESGSLLYTLSLPAKSTKCSLDVLITSLAKSLLSMAIVNMQCDLDDAGFIGVALTYLIKLPIINKSMASYSL